MYKDQLEKLKYPIGQANISANISDKDIQDWIHILKEFPGRLIQLTQGLSEDQLNTAYREGGWTIKQVVHHVADSHYNSYIRFKWTLTEDQPLIKAYHEDRWAKLIDYQAPIELSLNALSSVHAKLVYLLNGLSRDDLKREFIHPDGNRSVSLEKNIGIYAWHSQHHYAHIENLLKRKGWR